MALDNPRKQVLNLLIGLICVAVGAEETFAQGFDHWLRCDPAYWTQMTGRLTCRRWEADGVRQLK
jgi:hypothetical protein